MVVDEEVDTESDDQAFKVIAPKTKTPKVTFSLRNKQLDFTVDTGASVNIFSCATYRCIPE